MRHVRRQTVLVARAILVGALAAGTWRAVQILTIGGAYKVKVARLIALVDIGARISPVGTSQDGTGSLGMAESAYA